MSKPIPFLLLTLALLNLSSFLYGDAQDFKASENNKSASTFEAFTGKVTGNKVRLRAQPDLDGKVIRELNKGDLLIIVGENNGYYAVRPPQNTKAYVFRSYVLDNVVEGSRVNVRLEPSIDAPIIAQLTGGERIEGVICPSNNKWYEIPPPANAKFFVAKEYVQEIGNPLVFETIQKRKNEADDLLNKAYSISQSELRKPFNQISLESIYFQFNKILKEYQDFPEQVAKANEAMDLVQKTYLQKQIAYLESKTQQTEQSLQAKQASINAEIESYQKKLADLEEQLKTERNGTQTLASESQKNPPAPSFQAPSETQPAAPPNITKSIAIPVPTAQLRYWTPIEDGFYRIWLKSNPPAGMNEFYKAEEAKAITLEGVLAPFSANVKNRPGDYVLKVNNVPVAYLYSTKVNLQEKVGKQVKIVAVSRPKNNFAYPAYFVLSAE